jgi:ribonucleoside-triphosphate reductase
MDASFNKHEEWDANDPKRFEKEVAVMGCRTRVFENRFGDKTSIGRGNISFTTINFPGIAIEVAIEDGYLVKNEEGKYVFNHELNTLADQDRRLGKFTTKCLEIEKLVAKQLDERYQFQKRALAKQFPLLMKGMWNGSENLSPDDTIESVINQGTLGIGFIGLAEALVALTGKHHAEDHGMQDFGLVLLEKMKDLASELSEQYQHNYSMFATPAEGLSGKFTMKDRKKYGVIDKVNDRDYYTNSNHVPVYYKCTASQKARIECPYHRLTLGGHIFYVEADYDPTKNPDAIDVVNRIARDNNGGYISFNHNQGRCNYCNFESDDPNLATGDTCPHCGRKGCWDQLSRVTGYLISTTDRWNNGKINELKDRVVHM